MRRGGLSREPTPPHDGNVFAPQPGQDALHGEWGRHWLRAVPFATALVAVAVTVARRQNHREY